MADVIVLRNQEIFGAKNVIFLFALVFANVTLIHICEVTLGTRLVRESLKLRYQVFAVRREGDAKAEWIRWVRSHVSP